MSSFESFFDAFSASFPWCSNHDLGWKSSGSRRMPSHPRRTISLWRSTQRDTFRRCAGKKSERPGRREGKKMAMRMVAMVAAYIRRSMFFFSLGAHLR